MDMIDIYLYTTLIPNIGILFKVLTLLSGGVLLGLFTRWVKTYEEVIDDDDFYKYYSIRIAIALLIFTSLVMVIPNRQDFRQIAAISILTNTKNISKLPDNAVRYLNKYLKENSKKKDKR